MSLLRLHQIGCALLIALWSLAAGAVDAVVTGYELRATRPVPGSTSEFFYDYAAQLTNSGPPLQGVDGVVSSVNVAVVVIDNAVNFGTVDSGTKVTGIDTFTIRKRSTVVFRAEDLRWVITGTPASAIWADYTVTPSGGDAPLDVKFVPQTLSDTAIVSYRWDFNGDGTTDVNDQVGRAQTYRYLTPGTYTSALVVTDMQGRTQRQAHDVVVGNGAPQVSAISASPTNGAAPLNVAFSITAYDPDGIATYEWDFDGNGTYDRVLTAYYTTFSYPKAGVYAPKVRITDTRGGTTIVTSPLLEIRVGAAGSPRATLSVYPSSGPAPLTVQLSASVSDPQAGAVQKYEWDVDGNGTYDATTTTQPYSTIYGTGGSYNPRVKVTMVDGRTAIDVKPVVVTSTFGLTLVGTDTLDAQLGQTIGFDTTLSAQTRVSLVVEKRGTRERVRTLLPYTLRAAGVHRDVWDGKNDAGRYVPEGVYHLVMLYESDGVEKRFDLSTSTGGTEYSPPRTTLPTVFEPYNYQPLVVDYSLSRASEVTAFMGSYAVDVRYITFYTRRPFGRGSHRVTWSGESSNGQILRPIGDTQFLFGILAYTLPDNAVFVRNGVQVSNVMANPSVYDPTAHTSSGALHKSSVQFQLSLPAAADITIWESRTGAVVRRIRTAPLPAGTNAVEWDGKADDGRYVRPGTYRIGVAGVQASGYRSLANYVLQRVYF